MKANISYGPLYWWDMDTYSLNSTPGMCQGMAGSGWLAWMPYVYIDEGFGEVGYEIWLVDTTASTLSSLFGFNLVFLPLKVHSSCSFARNTRIASVLAHSQVSSL